MAKSDTERDARLAAALRDNLKRRKAQARAEENERPLLHPGEGRGPSDQD